MYNENAGTNHWNGRSTSGTGIGSAGYQGPMVTGTLRTAQDTPPVSSTIRDLTQRIEKARNGLESQGWRAKAIADSYFGSAPSKDSAGEPGVFEASAQALEYEAMKIEAALTLIGEQLDRLSCI